MYLEIRKIRQPSQSGAVVDQDVSDVGSTAPPRHWKGFYPCRRELRRIFLVKMLSVNSVRITLERDGPVFQVRKEEAGDANVIIDDLALGESRRVQHLFQIGDRDFSNRQ